MSVIRGPIFCVISCINCLTPLVNSESAKCTTFTVFYVFVNADCEYANTMFPLGPNFFLTLGMYLQFITITYANKCEYTYRV